MTDGAIDGRAVPDDGGACAGWATWPVSVPEAYDTTSMPGVVIDNVTGLMWQRDVDANTYTWAEAKTHCASLTLAGYSDWRSPTEIELASLFNPALPTPDPAVFPNSPVEPFWSSTTLAGNASFSWAAFFDSPGDGGVNVGPYSEYAFFDYPARSYRVRCVRGAAASLPQVHYTVANGTVVDHYTGLTWQRTVSPNTYGPLPSAAATYCGGLALAGGGWRLPTVQELLTLVDFCVGEPGPTIDEAAFPNTPVDWYWSSSVFTGDSEARWGVDFYSGAAFETIWLGGGVHVRCVR